jgi:succinate-semialdehyde dehydrogenase/glutarate-semialdehyde dehydrogenase
MPGESLHIAGRWTGLKQTFGVRDPATLGLIGECADGGAEQAVAASEAAAQAFGAWSSRPADERAGLLLQLADIVERDAPFFAGLLVHESGKPIRDAEAEVASTVTYLRWNAEEGRRISGRVLPPPRHGIRNWTLKQPLGVVAAITPWNYPLNTLSRKLGPAIAAGCTLVIKPAEETPLSAVELVRRVEEAGFPAGVVNLVTSCRPAEIAAAWLRDRKVRLIAFTGSTEAGKELLRGSADTFTRVSLELGGHAPFLVFDDADLDAAAEAAVRSRFRHAGQTCICAQRVLVQESVAETLIEKLKSRVTRLKVGPGSNSEVDLGPLINETAFRRVVKQVEDAVSKGARICTGGKPVRLDRPNLGFFFEPTLIDRGQPDMLVMHQETFGPVLVLQRFGSEREALELANDTGYGLVAYAFTSNHSRTHRLIEQLQYGTVGINETQVVWPQLPFGGLKESGLGKENGMEGVEEYLELKSAVVRIQEEP